MKRLHVHIAVKDLARSIDFYSTVFDCRPTIQHADYAKWSLEDPQVNFAISERGRVEGLDHLGVQVNSEAELDALTSRLEKAGETVAAQKGAQCCYARSDKTWSVDPSGIAWEAFHTVSEIPLYGQDTREDAAACCADSPCGVEASATGAARSDPAQACC